MCYRFRWKKVSVHVRPYTGKLGKRSDRWEWDRRITENGTRGNTGVPVFGFINTISLLTAAKNCSQTRHSTCMTTCLCRCTTVRRLYSPAWYCCTRPSGWVPVTAGDQGAAAAAGWVPAPPLPEYQLSEPSTAAGVSPLPAPSPHGVHVRSFRGASMCCPIGG